MERRQRWRKELEEEEEKEEEPPAWKTRKKRETDPKSDWGEIKNWMRDMTVMMFK